MPVSLYESQDIAVKADPHEMSRDLRRVRYDSCSPAAVAGERAGTLDRHGRNRDEYQTSAR